MPGKTKHKHVILVRGGPGTGKSVIALNALGEVLRHELKVFLVRGLPPSRTACAAFWANGWTG